MTKRDAERQCMRLIHKWQTRLFLGEWRLMFIFTREGADKSMDGNIAYVTKCPSHRTAKVVLNELLDPKWYESELLHELLHLKFHTVEEAIDALAEPAKTVVDDAQHAALGHLARVLVGVERTFPLKPTLPPGAPMAPPVAPAPAGPLAPPV